jgi:hypothetical protein
MAEQLKGPLGAGIIQLAPEKKLALIKDWLKQRQSLLVLDDVCLNGSSFGRSLSSQTASELRELVPGPPVSVLFTSRQRRLPGLPSPQILGVEAFTPTETEDVFTSYLGVEAQRHREVLLQFAERVERLAIAVTVGAELLRSQFGPISEGARSLALTKLRDEIHDVPGLFQRAVEAQGQNERGLLQAASVCAPDGFWLPLAADVAGLTQEESALARDQLVNASLLRVVDRERQRFQLHSLLREQLRFGVKEFTALQAAHASALENMFRNWQSQLQECSECLNEIMPATRLLLSSGEAARATLLTSWGSECAKRIGEFGLASLISSRQENLRAQLVTFSESTMTSQYNAV